MISNCPDKVMEHSNRVVLVPGASRPVGRAIARKFAANGARLVLPIYNDWPESIDEMKTEFSSSGYRFHCIPCDLTDKDETSGLIDRIEMEIGTLHVVINNIERGGMPVVHGSYDLEHNRDQWELELDTTLTAKWNLFHFALPLMKKSGDGALINISSIAGIIGRSGPASLLFSDGYSAANRSISSFTESWAREGAPDIRVNEVMLGLIRGRHGEDTRGWSAMSTSQRQALIDHTLLKRSGTPDEVADIVYFLAEKAPYVTGSLFRVDGGYCLASEKPSITPSGILGQ
jgi:3-oxoacyl-[acyl-carrier protein] reductase